MPSGRGRYGRVFGMAAAGRWSAWVAAVIGVRIARRLCRRALALSPVPSCRDLADRVPVHVGEPYVGAVECDPGRDVEAVYAAGQDLRE
jgi:hypothetical protein